MRIRIAVLLTAAFVTALATAAGAQAAIVVGNANDSGTGSLRQALLDAPPGETIVVPAGTYTLTSEPLKVTKSVTISGAGAIIRAGGAFAVLSIKGPLDATITGVTIRDGSPTMPSGSIQGGGIAAEEANLVLRNVVVTNNVANTDGAPGKGGGIAYGGGIYLDTGSLTISESTVNANRVSAVGGAGAGGGIAKGAGIYTDEAPVSLTRTTVNGNAAAVPGGSGGGGGIIEGGGIFVGESSLSIDGGAVDGNSANAAGGSGAGGGIVEGGGMELDEGTLTLADTSVSGNTAAAPGGSEAGGGLAYGGGVSGEGSLSIVRTTIARNLAEARSGAGKSGGIVDGGGISFELETGTSSISSSTIAENVADSTAGAGGNGGISEGGGFAADADKFALSITATTIASNVVKSGTGGRADGGGLYGEADEGVGSISLVAATIAANRSEVPAVTTSHGGNLLVDGPISARNTIVTSGVGPAGSENCSKAIATSLGFNLESGDQCGFHAAGDLINRNPLLGPLQLNGGPTQTMALGLGSPAIDQGAASGLLVDQRGALRPLDFPSIPNSAAAGADGSDIGAFELQPSNAFSLGKLTKNKKKGTATLIVTLPQPSVGMLSLDGKGLKSQTTAIAGQSEVRFTVATKGGVRKALRKKGKRMVGIRVTFAPPATTAATQSLNTKLVRKHKKKHRKKHGKH